MTRRALLHLGMNKTGTSSIQRSLANYADADWRYLQLGHPNHSAIFMLGFLDDVPRNVAASLELDAKDMTAEAARATIASALAQDRRSVVVSGEGLSSHFERAGVDRVLSAMRAEVDEVRALAYLRDPISFASSNFQQMARLGLPSDDLSRLVPKYRHRFRPWIEALGNEAVQLAAYDPGGFADGDLIADFAQRAGLDPKRAMAGAKRVNDANTAEATALLFAMHRQLGERRLTGRLLKGGRALIGLMRGFGQHKFAWSEAALSIGLERRAKDIAWAEAQMGRAMPPASSQGRMVFGSTDELLDYAATLGADLAVFLSEHGHDPAGAEADPAGALLRLLRKFADKPPARLRGMRAKLWRKTLS